MENITNNDDPHDDPFQDWDYVIRECSVCSLIVNDNEEFYLEPIGGGQVVQREHRDCQARGTPTQ